jgi:hypothetical protein
MWCPIGIPFQSDGRHSNRRRLSEPLFQSVIFRTAFGQAQSPAVVMDHDDDMIRIVEGRCRAVEGCVIEVPLGRSDLPDELRKFIAVLFIARTAAFSGEVELIPPRELCLGRLDSCVDSNCSISSLLFLNDSLLAQPNVNAKTSAPRSRNSISNCRLVMEVG